MSVYIDWEEVNDSYIWKNDCDFWAKNVRDIEVVDSSKYDYGRLCQERFGCTHFVWNGKCILKNASVSENLSYLKHAICGKLEESKLIGKKKHVHYLVSN